MMETLALMFGWMRVRVMRSYNIVNYVIQSVKHWSGIGYDDYTYNLVILERKNVMNVPV